MIKMSSMNPRIEACDGSAAQKWTLRKATAAPGGNSVSADGDGLAPAAGEEYQIVAASGQCLANTVATVRAHTADLVERAHEPPQRADEGLSFDVAASLGSALGHRLAQAWDGRGGLEIGTGPAALEYSASSVASFVCVLFEEGGTPCVLMADVSKV